MIKDKLENIISGYKINQDDADWLRGILWNKDEESFNYGVSKYKEGYDNGYSEGYTKGNEDGEQGKYNPPE